MSEVTKRQVPGDVFFEGLSDLPENRIHRGAVCMCTRAAFTGEIDR